MITPDNLPGILDALCWPLLVLVFVWLFKNDIRGLVKRLVKAELPGSAFEFGDASIDKPVQQPSPEPKTESVAKAKQPKRDSIRWGNSGNLFWAGHDLMWTIDVLLRGAPREKIAYGLKQSLHHVSSLGLVGPPIESRLARLKAEADSTLQKDWTPSLRNEYARELTSLINDIGKRADANQVDYEPTPRQ